MSGIIFLEESPMKKKQLKMNKLSGVGASLRFDYLESLESDLDRYDFFEILVDNILDDSASFYSHLKNLLRAKPIAFHCVNMNLGSSKGVDLGYVDKIAEMVEMLRPAVISDHLAWTAFDGKYFHDLLPLPYNQESLKIVCNNIEQVQNKLGRQIAIENPSTYLALKGSEIDEAEFIKMTCEQSGCSLLLDVNNVVVNCFNQGMDQHSYINTLMDAPVSYIHMAGHEVRNSHLFDSHSAPPSEESLKLYAYALEKLGETPTILEWDADLPEYQDFCQELSKIQKIYQGYES